MTNNNDHLRAERCRARPHLIVLQPIDDRTARPISNAGMSADDIGGSTRLLQFCDRLRLEQ